MEFVVTGEASETDEESVDLSRKKAQVLLATEVSGEETETESDEELYERKEILESPDEVSQLGNNNLLQRKLMSNNLSIWNNTKSFPKNYVTSASKTIVSCDQLLVRSMQLMQSVALSLKSTHNNTQLLRQQVKHLNFVPEIIISNK